MNTVDSAIAALQSDPPGDTPKPAGGASLDLIYTNDLLANLSGGNRRGTVDQGKLEAIVAADLESLLGLRGLSFFANAFQIHNTGRIRRDYVGGVNTIAAIEAAPATRLSELWLEQALSGTKASIRVGQLAADAEFLISDLSVMFLQSDWPTITALNLPSGGPAYPLSTPGARLKIVPHEDLTVLLAVFNGDPAGPGSGDEQQRNRHGLNFRTSDSALMMAELQLRTNRAPQDVSLARTLKLGGWSHRGTFDDLRTADDGTSLADPNGSGVPAQRKYSSGIYAIIDQQLFRPAGGDAESGISVFGRIAFARPDRNAIDFYIDGGVVVAGLVPGRPKDRFGVSTIYARFSEGIRGLDSDTVRFTGNPGVIRDYEANIEATYLAHVAKGWTVQPVLTRVLHPSGDRSRNATVAGVRVMWRLQ